MRNDIFSQKNDLAHVMNFMVLIFARRANNPSR